jgi:hypothetical protein
VPYPENVMLSLEGLDCAVVVRAVLMTTTR